MLRTQQLPCCFNHGAWLSWELLQATENYQIVEKGGGQSQPIALVEPWYAIGPNNVA